MAATATPSTAARQLRQYQRQDGNWRLKGLLLALADGVDERTVGRAWPRPQPRSRRDYVQLGTRHDDTHEHQTARELYGKEAIVTGETVHRDEYISRVLASDAGTEKDVLWREELLDTVIRGAETRKIAREATTVTEVGAKRGDLPTPGHDQFAATGAEGAGAEFDEGDYNQTAYTCERHEEGFALTDELVDQAAVELLEREIARAGMAIENAINRQYLVNVVDNANQDHTVGGNSVIVKDAFEAMENVTDNDFDPADTLVMHPEFRTEFADQATFVTTDEPAAGNGISPELFVASDATYNGLDREPAPSTSNTWGWEAGGEIGGVVHGSDYVHTVVYRDIGVSELTEPLTAIKDLQGGVARAWTDSVQASNDAISTITQ